MVPLMHTTDHTVTTGRKRFPTAERARLLLALLDDVYPGGLDRRKGFGSADIPTRLTEDAARRYPEVPSWSAQTVSKALHDLEDAGAITTERSGPTATAARGPVIYSLRVVPPESRERADRNAAALAGSSDEAAPALPLDAPPVDEVLARLDALAVEVAALRSAQDATAERIAGADTKLDEVGARLDRLAEVWA